MMINNIGDQSNQIINEYFNLHGNTNTSVIL